jgi:hypothetical protein
MINHENVCSPRNTVELEMTRTHSGDAFISDLLWEGVHQCFILEGVTTAIPAGRYEIRLTHSERFGRTLPILCDVPGRKGIRIHPGNKPVDTLGCLLPGTDREEGKVLQSVVAFDVLFARLQLSAGPIFLTIKDAP